MKKRIVLIAAVAKNNVIGVGGRLPWHLPADLAHFQALTLGKPVIMGRKTFESLPRRPLPDRLNIVLARDQNYPVPAGCTVFTSLKEAIKHTDAKQIFIIGGASVYAQALPFAERIYLTRVDCEPKGDVFFPILNPAEWEEVEREDHAADEKNPYNYSFLTLKRR